MKRSISVILLMLLISVSCSRPENQVNELKDGVHVQGIKQFETISADVLHNENFIVEYDLKMTAMKMMIFFAENDGRSLLGGVLPVSYEKFIEEGSLVLIPHNRYSEGPVLNVIEHRPGDIFLEYDFEKGTRSFALHNGEKDLLFKPEVCSDSALRRLNNSSDTYSDGKSIFYISDVEEQWFSENNREIARESYGIPGDDEARVRVYLLYHVMKDIMQRSGWLFEVPPDDFNYYVEFVGEKNPSAWINLYDGGESREVIFYYPEIVFNASGEQDGKLKADFSIIEKIDTETLPGNYAYKIIRLDDGKEIGVALFYFRLPNGEVSAYQAVSMGRSLLESGWSWLSEI